MKNKQIQKMYKNKTRSKQAKRLVLSFGEPNFKNKKPPPPPPKKKKNKNEQTIHNK